MLLFGATIYVELVSVVCYIERHRKLLKTKTGRSRSQGYTHPTQLLLVKVARLHTPHTTPIGQGRKVTHTPHNSYWSRSQGYTHPTQLLLVKVARLHAPHTTPIGQIYRKLLHWKVAVHMKFSGKVSRGVWEENKRIKDSGRWRPGDAAFEAAECHCESSGIQGVKGESQWDGNASAECHGTG